MYICSFAILYILYGLLVITVCCILYAFPREGNKRINQTAFPIGILGQVWYLIVSIPDLCTLTYFQYLRHGPLICFNNSQIYGLAQED